MRTRIIITGFLLTLMIGSISAQDINMPELKGFKKLSNYPVFGPDKLWDFINGAADTYLAYGFADLHVAEYKKGKDVIKLEIYKQSDHTMAFGIYSTERSSSYRFLNLGSQGYVADGAINFFKGNYYVKIRTYSKNVKTLNAEQSLAQKVASMLSGSLEMPAELSAFPQNGKKNNEETYINESVLGHKFLEKAFKAIYESGPDNFAIFIMDKNSNEDVKKTVDSYLTSTGTDASGVESARYMLKDGYNGTIFLAWKENRIVIISGLSKDQADIADRYTTDIIR